jgi:hypothetical protein
MLEHPKFTEKLENKFCLYFYSGEKWKIDMYSLIFVGA